MHAAVVSYVFAETPAGLSFVGDFDGLYAAEADPWGQSATEGQMADYYGHSRANLVAALVRHCPRKRGVEVGCGHGHLTADLNLVTRVRGVDISAAAVERARALHPRLEFAQADVTKDAIGEADFVIWAQVLWYVLHEIDAALQNTLNAIPPGGLFIVSQAFLREQRYGREVADGFDGALRMFMGRPELRVIEACHDDSERFCHHDGLMVFRKR